MHTRETLLFLHDLLTQEVYVPQWDVTVRVRGLTGAEREEVIASNYSHALVVSFGVIDEENRNIFSSADIPALSQKSAQALHVLSEAILDLSGMSSQSIERISKGLRENEEQQFWFHLAGYLGGRTVREWQHTMPAYEFMCWRQISRIEPFGVLRGDLQAGIVASLVANMFRDSKKRQEPYRPSDFVLKFEERPTAQAEQNGPPRQPWQQILFNLQMVKARQDVKRDGKELKGVT